MTDAEIILALGGATEVAKMLGTKQQVVQHWVTSSRIPRKHHARLFSVAEKHGKALHPSNFFAETWSDGTSEWRRRHRSKYGQSPERN